MTYAEIVAATVTLLSDSPESRAELARYLQGALPGQHPGRAHYLLELSLAAVAGHGLVQISE